MTCHFWSFDFGQKLTFDWSNVDHRHFDFCPCVMHLLENWWGPVPLPKPGKEEGARHPWRVPKLEVPRSPCWTGTPSPFWILIRLLLRIKFDWS